MYMFENMLDMAMRGDDEWPSDDHKRVAANCCLGNPLIKDMDTLAENIRIINSIGQDKIRIITGCELLTLGCDI